MIVGCDFITGTSSELHGIYGTWEYYNKNNDNFGGYDEVTEIAVFNKDRTGTYYRYDKWKEHGVEDSSDNKTPFHYTVYGDSVKIYYDGDNKDSGLRYTGGNTFVWVGVTFTRK
jgi:hypothetical protein